MSRNHEKAVAALNELKYFREGIGSFGDPSAVAPQQKLDPKRGEMELDEEVDDPDDPPWPNTFLVLVIERMQTGGDARVAEDTPSTYNVRLFGDESYNPYYECFVDIHAQHDEED
ncbi:hypothetical protein Taro_042528 [Colocasia esculenta]|uniref:Uncharacterized protein n=1 Tax=Colocasia esculenta TaxID=4460 RepID=A0A843WWR0_COLES|nr:hypothetical protein [Colocasia esculenta]